MSILSTYLQQMQRIVPPTSAFAGVLLEGSGPPTSGSSPFYCFYRDTLTDKLYINPDRTAGAWLELAGADSIGEVLTADV